MMIRSLSSLSLVALFVLVKTSQSLPPSPFNYGLSSKAADRTVAAIQSFQNANFGAFMHNGPVTQWGADIGWPLVCVSFPCDVQGPDNTTRTLTTTEELKAHRQEYIDLARTWNPMNWDAADIASKAKKAGMKYFVYTTVHCDGFADWDTNVTTFNVMNSPFGRDIYGELVDALRVEGIKVGAYLCVTQWGPDDKNFVYPDPLTTLNSNGGEIPTYDPAEFPERWDGVVDKLHNMVTELATKYSPDIFWFDCHSAPPYDTRLEQVVPHIRTSNEDALVLIRNGIFTDWTELPDQTEESVRNMMPFESAAAPFEVCGTLQASQQWAYDPLSDAKPASKILANLMMIVAKGGNYLLNLSPSPTGEFSTPANAVLSDLADWFVVNGEALGHNDGPTFPLFPYQSVNAVGETGSVAYFTSKNLDGGGVVCYVMVPATMPGDGVDTPNDNFDNMYRISEFRAGLLAPGVSLSSVTLLGASDDAVVNYVLNDDGLEIYAGNLDSSASSLKDGKVFRVEFVDQALVEL